MLRPLGIALVVLSLIGLAVATPAMVRRLSSRHITMVWFDEPILDESFKFRGEPVGLRTDPASGDDPAKFVITFRGGRFEQPIEPGMRHDPRLPGLLRHDDWLRVLPMAEGARSEAELIRGIAAHTINPRIIIAMRLPGLEFVPGSWGDVHRRQWRYRFVELLPADISPAEPFALTESTYGELDKLGDPKLVAADHLESEVWKYYAMQHVTPPTLYRSKNKPIDDAMQAMGWTWPVAGTSMLVLTVGLVMVVVGGGTRAGID